MNQTESLGQFEQLVLSAIVALGDKAYGVTIQEKVEQLADRKPASSGAVYVTLDRLEDKGLFTRGSPIQPPNAVEDENAITSCRLPAKGHSRNR